MASSSRLSMHTAAFGIAILATATLAVSWNPAPVVRVVVFHDPHEPEALNAFRTGIVEACAHWGARLDYVDIEHIGDSRGAFDKALREVPRDSVLICRAPDARGLDFLHERGIRVVTVAASPIAQTHAAVIASFADVEHVIGALYVVTPGQQVQVPPASRLITTTHDRFIHDMKRLEGHESEAVVMTPTLLQRSDALATALAMRPFRRVVVAPAATAADGWKAAEIALRPKTDTIFSRQV